MYLPPVHPSYSYLKQQKSKWRPYLQKCLLMLKFNGTIDLFHLYILFSQHRYVIILKRLGPLFCSLKRMHAGIFMLACPHFNEQNKGPKLLSILSHGLYWENKMYKRKRSIRAGHQNLSCIQLLAFLNGSDFFVTTVALLEIKGPEFRDIFFDKSSILSHKTSKASKFQES